MSTTETRTKVSENVSAYGSWQLTTHASVVGLNVSLLDLAVLDDQGVALAAVVAENGSGIEVEIESLGELAVGVGKEADLMVGDLVWLSEQATR